MHSNDFLAPVGAGTLSQKWLDTDQAPDKESGPGDLKLQGCLEFFAGTGDVSSLPAEDVCWWQSVLPNAGAILDKHVAQHQREQKGNQLGLLWNPTPSTAHALRHTEQGAGKSCAYQVGKWRLPRWWNLEVGHSGCRAWLLIHPPSTEQILHPGCRLGACIAEPESCINTRSKRQGWPSDWPIWRGDLQSKM